MLIFVTGTELKIVLSNRYDSNLLSQLSVLNGSSTFIHLTCRTVSKRALKLKNVSFLIFMESLTDFFGNAVPKIGWVS